MKGLLEHSAGARHHAKVLRCDGSEVRIAGFMRHIQRHCVQCDRTIQIATLPRDVCPNDVAMSEPDPVRNVVRELLGRRDRLQRTIVLGVILMRACNPPQQCHASSRIVARFEFHQCTGVRLARRVASAVAFVRLSERDQCIYRFAGELHNGRIGWCESTSGGHALWFVVRFGHDQMAGGCAQPGHEIDV